MPLSTFEIHELLDACRTRRDGSARARLSELRELCIERYMELGWRERLRPEVRHEARRILNEEWEPVLAEAIASDCRGTRFRQKINTLLNRRVTHLEVYAGRAIPREQRFGDGVGDNRPAPEPSRLDTAFAESLEIVERLWPYAGAENERQLLTALHYGLGRPFGWSDLACKRLIEKMESRAAEFPDSCFNSERIGNASQPQRYDVRMLIRLRPYVQNETELLTVDALIIGSSVSASAEFVDELVREKLVSRAAAEPNGPKRPFILPRCRVAAA